MSGHGLAVTPLASEGSCPVLDRMEFNVSFSSVEYGSTVCFLSQRINLTYLIVIMGLFLPGGHSLSKRARGFWS